MLKLDNKYLLSITQDDFAENPMEWEQLGTILTWEDSYKSPCRNDYSSPEEFVDDYLGEDSYEKIENNSNSLVDFMKDIQNKFDKKGYLIYPVTRFEHSLVEYYIGLGGGFDSGLIGFAIVSKDEVRQMYNTKDIYKSTVQADFSQQLEIYTDYVNGEVYCFSLMDMEQNVIDICSGFYGTEFDKNRLMQTVNESFENDTKMEDWEQAKEKVVYY